MIPASRKSAFFAALALLFAGVIGAFMVYVLSEQKETEGRVTVIERKGSPTAQKAVAENRDVICDLGRLVRVAPVSTEVGLPGETKQEREHRLTLVNRFKAGLKAIDCHDKGITAPLEGGGAGGPSQGGGPGLPGGGKPPGNGPHAGKAPRFETLPVEQVEAGKITEQLRGAIPPAPIELPEAPPVPVPPTV